MKTLSTTKINQHNKENTPSPVLVPQTLSVKELFDLLNPAKIYQKITPPIEIDDIPPTVVEKYKTELCRNWQQGNCNFGSTCKFAHGQTELQNDCAINQKYKSKQCQLFHEDGYCPYGSRCHFIHIEIKDQAEVSRPYQTQLMDITNIPQKERLCVFLKFCV